MRPHESTRHFPPVANYKTRIGPRGRLIRLRDRRARGESSLAGKGRTSEFRETTTKESIICARSSKYGLRSF